MLQSLKVKEESLMNAKQALDESKKELKAREEQMEQSNFAMLQVEI